MRYAKQIVVKANPINGANMPQMSLAQGILPLTQGAAGAALDAIDFIAAVVRGFNATDIASIVKPICANTVNQNECDEWPPFKWTAQ
jgi:hypothetical protein